MRTELKRWDKKHKRKFRKLGFYKSEVLNLLRPQWRSTSRCSSGRPTFQCSNDDRSLKTLVMINLSRLQWRPTSRSPVDAWSPEILLTSDLPRSRWCLICWSPVEAWPNKTLKKKADLTRSTYWLIWFVSDRSKIIDRKYFTTSFIHWSRIRSYYFKYHKWIHQLISRTGTYYFKYHKRVRGTMDGFKLNSMLDRTKYFIAMEPT